jgi:hypothetical protein
MKDYDNFFLPAGDLEKAKAFYHGMEDSKISPEDLGTLKGSIASVQVHGTKPKM